MLSRPNVEVIEGGSADIEGNDVVTTDGSRRTVEAIIFATGFASTDFLVPMRINGLGGQNLRDEG